ncbi:hypothetical protein [Bernardetia sp.]|uniref:hypothetical protein n=1 Tax=Bernardetia sp. TaxID=1937974 RepID=UPI0025BF9158|nr:hypothetical protein [Bernardetia sp.]
MDEQEIAKYKEQLRLRKLGVAIYELQTILGQKISAAEKTQKAKNYYLKIDNAVKGEGVILDLMYKITGEKINAENYQKPLKTPPNPIRKNQTALNNYLQEKQIQAKTKPTTLAKQTASKTTVTAPVTQPPKQNSFPITTYLSIRDIYEEDDETFFKKGRDKTVSNSIFVIHQISATEATFETYKEMKTNFFNSFYRSLSGFVFAFNVVGSPSFEDDKVETIEKGKLTKENEYWRVTQKAKIEFKKAEE